MIKVSELRHKFDIIDGKPGYYIWWAKKPELELLLEKLGTTFAEVKEYLYQKEDLYAIYTGIATKRSLKSRIIWHLNDPHTLSKIKSGALSTFRQSIASLVAGTQEDKKATDDFLDKLYLEYHINDHPINSEQAKQSIHKLENELMQSYLFIINIKDNAHDASGDIKRKLREIRREAKDKAISSLS